MGKRDVERELKELRSLRGGHPGDVLPQLTKALGDSINAVAACAANIIGEKSWGAAIPALVEAFERFSVEAGARDPQCLAKIAIARALKELGYGESALFLKGANHIQMEAVWGGKEDSAAPLRGVCLLALIQCPDLPREDVLRQLVFSMNDRFSTVRGEAVRAVAQMGGVESTLLLRLKTLLGDRDSAVTGTAMESLIAMEGSRGIEFVAKFLRDLDENVQDEAVLALGASRQPAAVELLMEQWRTSRSLVILRALGISRSEAASAFLEGIVRTGREREAQAAREALAVLLG